MKKVYWIILAVCATAVIVAILIKCSIGQYASFMKEARTERVTHEFSVTAATIHKDSKLVILTTTQTAVHRTTYDKDLWGMPLPTIEVNSSFPVTFYYYLDLTEQWDFTVEETRLIVHTPPIRVLEPAIDTSKLIVRSNRSMWRFDEEKVKEQHMQELSKFAKHTAHKNIPNVYDSARLSVVTFIKQWVYERFITQPIEQELFEQNTEIVILFKNEPERTEPQ